MVGTGCVSSTTAGELQLESNAARTISDRQRLGIYGGRVVACSAQTFIIDGLTKVGSADMSESIGRPEGLRLTLLSFLWDHRQASRKVSAGSKAKHCLKEYLKAFGKSDQCCVRLRIGRELIVDGDLVVP